LLVGFGFELLCEMIVWTMRWQSVTEDGERGFAPVPAAPSDHCHAWEERPIPVPAMFSVVLE